MTQPPSGSPEPPRPEFGNQGGGFGQPTPGEQPGGYGAPQAPYPGTPGNAPASGNPFAASGPPAPQPPFGDQGGFPPPGQPSGPPIQPSGPPVQPSGPPNSEDATRQYSVDPYAASAASAPPNPYGQGGGPQGPFPPQPPYGQQPYGQDPYGQQPYGGGFGAPPKKKTGLIVGIVVGALVLLIGIGVGGWLLLGGGGTEDDVKSVVKDYFKASQDKDLDAMKKHLCKASKDQASTRRPPPKTATIKIDETKKESDKEYTVKATVTIGGQGQKYKIVVVKEDGDWLVCALGADRTSSESSSGSSRSRGSTSGSDSDVPGPSMPSSPYGSGSSPYGSGTSPYGGSSPYGSGTSPYGGSSPYGSGTSPYGSGSSPYSSSGSSSGGLS